MKVELSINQLETLRKENNAIIDVRHPNEFALQFIPGSYNVYIDDGFKDHASFFVQKDQAMVIVDREANGDGNYKKISALGYKNLKGYLKGGIDIWADFGKRLDMVISISAYEFSLELKHSNMNFIDIRNEEEYEKSRIVDALNVMPKDIIYGHFGLDKEMMYCFFCEDGILSMSLNSYLKTKGYHNIYHLSGGFAAARQEKGIDII